MENKLLDIAEDIVIFAIGGLFVYGLCAGHI